MPEPDAQPDLPEPDRAALRAAVADAQRAGDRGRIADAYSAAIRGGAYRSA